MTEALPIFPLGSVLFPGLLLPLHIFEERYRDLVRDLVALPEEAPRRFGVVCIKAGREVGVDGVRALHAVGCTAELTQVAQLPDGRYDIVTIGGRRFTLGALDTARSYLSAQVSFLDETLGDHESSTVLAERVRLAFTQYLVLLGEAGGGGATVPELPEDALTLGYLVAATMILDWSDKQDLLAAPDAVSRLARVLRLLRREIALLQVLPSAPVPDLTRTVASPN